MLIYISFYRLSPDIQSNRTGELDHGDPFCVCCCCCTAAPQGGHRTAAAGRDPQAGAEDWHGRENEEDGRHAAFHHNWCQEEEDHTGAGMQLRTGIATAVTTNPRHLIGFFFSQTFICLYTFISALKAPKEGENLFCSVCLNDSLS